MDHSQSGAHLESRDAEWESRVERAAHADVRELLRSVRRRRRERWLVGSVGLVAVALVLVLLFRIGLFDGAAADGAQAPGPEPTEPAALVLDLSRPFAKTPAADWSDGAAGIVLPPAQRVGEFSAERVAAALRDVRDVLVASRLDPRLVVDHDPGAFLAALAPDARRQLEPLFGSGHEAEAQSLVSMVAAGTRLLPVEPKVNGRMTVRAGGEGELVVHTNYVFVYAFHTDRPEKIVDPMDILVVVRAEVDYILRVGDRWARGSQGWWYDKTAGYAYSIACDAYRKGFLAPAFTDPTHTEAHGRDRGVYFDPTGPLPPTSGCAS
ncbi:MAG TPA: hypothetical protein VGX25_31080 [Actinophytocola sp.]|uniref:hypothetical protein n=1 Tax=Actinophytocola sp. TaxID=1872138 RepID=UPI002DDD02D1|nr:hypothetical protein [Actinophytocola sp.]HEV2783852.1 hypothetical protein [Actinophytocola sp.]